MNRRLFAVVAFACILCHFGCGESGLGNVSGEGWNVSFLVEEASRDIENQRFDTAMVKALKALEMAQKAGSAKDEVNALSCITGIDIMTSRDDDAWEKATQAEALARKNSLKKELAGILISKAKLC